MIDFHRIFTRGAATLVLACAVQSAMAQDAAPSVDAEEDAIAKASAPMTVTATELLQTRRDDWLREKGLTLGDRNKGGTYIQWGASTVSVDPADAGWGKARVAAYQNAMFNAQKEFLLYRRQLIRTKAVVDLMSDGSQLSPPELGPQEEKSRWQVVFDKLLGISEAELNAKLREAGLDPKEFEGKPPAEKVNALTNRLEMRSAVQAAASLRGVRTLQTFEGRDDQGHYAIGVLIAYSSKFEGLAAAIASGRATHEGTAPAGKPIHEQISTEPGALVDDFGVRVLIDEHGDRCIVSFGQWAPTESGAGTRSRERWLMVAQEQATNQARAALVNFANSTLKLSEESAVGEVVQEYTERRAGEPDRVFESAELIDTLNRRLERDGTLDISGLTPIHTWSAKHPETKRDLVGVVLMWSPTSQQNAQNVGRIQKPSATPTKQQVPQGKAGVRNGNDYDSANDW